MNFHHLKRQLQFDYTARTHNESSIFLNLEMNRDALLKPICNASECVRTFLRPFIFHGVFPGHFLGPRCLNSGNRLHLCPN